MANVAVESIVEGAAAAHDKERSRMRRRRMERMVAV
jgi:hypothetical protein